MPAEGFDQYFDVITDHCLEVFNRDREHDVIALSTEIMKLPGFPIHYPTHHYLVPAVLLTACRKLQGHDSEVLRRDLEAALERARMVPGGSCGNLGACGAAVGVGIFWSIITDTSPLSEQTWAHGNRATATALLQMAETGGPRCCKRCTWRALMSARPMIKEVLRLDLPAQPPRCTFHDDNNECIKERCPFFPKED